MVFIVDDNFIGDKRRTKALLHEMIAWRKRTRPEMGFLTEASVNLADDAELCALMVEAGFTKVFVGIETPSAESLEECRKFQNQGRDLVAAVQTLQRDGLEVMGGFIVGFDSDQPDIFKRQFEFIQRSGVVTAMVGLAHGPAADPAVPTIETRRPAGAEEHRQQHRCDLELPAEAEPRISAIGLSRTDAAAVRARGLLPAHPDVPEKSSPDRPRCGCRGRTSKRS